MNLAICHSRLISTAHLWDAIKRRKSKVKNKAANSDCGCSSS